MTVQQAIDELMKIEDRSVSLFFDCPTCGKGMMMWEVQQCVLVKTERPRATLNTQA